MLEAWKLNRKGSPYFRKAVFDVIQGLYYVDAKSGFVIE